MAKTKTKKKAAKAEVLVTLHFFDLGPGRQRGAPFDEIARTPYENAALGSVPGLDHGMYRPRGSTPLRDATVGAIRRMEDRFAAQPDAIHLAAIVDESGSMSGKERSVVDGLNEFVDTLREEDATGEGRCLVLIMTDGLENASETTEEALRDLIHEKEGDGWRFIYLGANQDAWAAGASMGISTPGAFANYTPSATGTSSSIGNLAERGKAFLKTNNSATYDTALRSAGYAAQGFSVEEDPEKAKAQNEALAKAADEAEKEREKAQKEQADRRSKEVKDAAKDALK